MLVADSVAPVTHRTTNLFDWLDWQAKPASRASGKVVRIGDGRGPAPTTLNRRVAAVRGLFEYAVICGARTDNPVPPGRRATGLRANRRGMLGHLGSRGVPGSLVMRSRRVTAVTIRARGPSWSFSGPS